MRVAVLPSQSSGIVPLVIVTGLFVFGLNVRRGIPRCAVFTPDLTATSVNRSSFEFQF